MSNSPENTEKLQTNSNHLEHLQILENDFETENFGKQEMPNLDNNKVKKIGEKIGENQLIKEILETGNLANKQNQANSSEDLDQNLANNSKVIEQKNQENQGSQTSQSLQKLENQNLQKNSDNSDNSDWDRSTKLEVEKEIEKNEESEPKVLSNKAEIESNSNKKTIISIIIPCFNEQENIQDCYDELVKVWAKLPLYDYEFVFVDDGSSDWTVLAITKLQLTDVRVKLVEFSRNFGKEIAISAGFVYCTGIAAMIVDADLQYPVEKIPEFITLWESGSEVVIGLRDKKKTNNLIERYGSKLFYWIMGKIGEIEIIPGALDFRLIDREIIDHFNTFTERSRMARALVDWLGFDRSFVNYTEKPRNKGTASYSFAKRLKLATESFILHSLFPLKFAGYLGVLITISTAFVGTYAFFNQFFWDTQTRLYLSGPVFLGLLNLFLIGIVLVCLGLIALYIANIHTEVVNRPLFVVKTNRAKTQSRMSIIVKD